MSEPAKPLMRYKAEVDFTGNTWAEVVDAVESFLGSLREHEDSPPLCMSGDRYLANLAETDPWQTPEGYATELAEWRRWEGQSS